MSSECVKLTPSEHVHSSGTSTSLSVSPRGPDDADNPHLSLSRPDPHTPIEAATDEIDQFLEEERVGRDLLADRMMASMSDQEMPPRVPALFLRHEADLEALISERTFEIVPLLSIRAFLDLALDEDTSHEARV